MTHQKITSGWSLSRMTLLSVVVLFTLFGAGCKSKKKAMEAERAAKEKARLEQEMADKKKREEEERLRREAEERARREKEEADRANAAATKGPAAKLNDYFNAIASSGNAASANSSINEALALFSSPSTPVLIVISEEGGEKDYDRPTTIKDYLNYVKDQKKNVNKISNLQFDNSGKITEVELVKQK